MRSRLDGTVSSEEAERVLTAVLSAVSCDSPPSRERYTRRLRAFGMTWGAENFLDSLLAPAR